MRVGRFACALGGVLFTMVASPAAAVQAPPGLAGRPALEVFAGSPVDDARALVWDRIPAAAHLGWAEMLVELPGARAVWDPVTHVPRRIWGPAIFVPGAVSSPSEAVRFATGFLARHVNLLAPGSSATDFILVANDLSNGMRTLGYRQRAKGLDVLGGQLSFRFKNDRLLLIASEALPDVQVSIPAQLVPAGAAASSATAWLLTDVAQRVDVLDVNGAMVLPLVSRTGVRYATVRRVVLGSEPLGRWNVYVDAHNAQPVAREQMLRFASGTVLFNTPERRPGAVRLDYPAPFINLDVGGQAVTSDLGGMVSWGQGDVTVNATLDGTYTHVQNVAGADAVSSMPLSPGGSAIWNAAQDEHVDSQLTIFVHTNRVVEYCRAFAQGLPWLDAKVPAFANINDTCNAYYDNETINFFIAQGGCENTGRLPDVVYHEYGHSLHDHGIIPGVGAFEGGLSEGLSDYLSATITGDPKMGIGFFQSAAPLRDIDPSDHEQVWPDDVGEVHYTGMIISGALWDMRKLLVAELGDEDQARAVADHLYYEAMRRASDIPSMYFEALAADDDDGDLTNGTPHICAINGGFTPHGLRKVFPQSSTPPIAPPGLDGYVVSFALVGLHPSCPSDQLGDAQVEWRRRDDSTIGGTLPMLLGADGFEATIPSQPDGVVVQYRVKVDVGGTETTYPINAADPWYEMFVGEVAEIYCTDFEHDPAADGWTHGLTSGQPGEGADDWMWGEPQAPTDSGDPPSAFSGTQVFGNDLGGGNYNGQYQPNKVNYALSPIIDTTGYEVVRLQYRRWLTVEDAHFDKASIYADEVPVWQNLDSMQGDQSNTQHLDQEWRFQDVDLSAQTVDHSVQLRFEIQSDGGLEMGGWTLDDLCVVGWVPTVCGDGKITGVEECDDGAENSDVAADACRTDCSAASCGDGVRDSGEECDEATDACEVDCTLAPIDPNDPNNPNGVPPLDPGADGGCGCRTVGSSGDDGGLLVALGLALGLVRRRRRD
jgi:MYXO-CTERM domain-containing protein